MRWRAPSAPWPVREKYAKVQTQLLELLIELERAKENPAVSDVLLECLSYCDWSNGQDLILMADFFATLNGGKTRNISHFTGRSFKMP